MRTARAALVAAGVAAAATAGGVLVTGAGSAQPDPQASPRSAAAALPAPAHGGLDVPRPRALGTERGLSTWAPLRRAAVARAAPDRAAAPVARLEARTPEATTNLVLVLGRAQDRHGATWVRARLPVLGRAVGWLPRAALGGYGTVRTRLVVDRRRLRLTLLRDGHAVLRAPVGVGAPGTPTPAGSFYVRDRVTAYASPVYGPIAFGTSARSRTLTDWPGGGFVGIHGTDQPGLLPGRVSHGCVRLRNADVLRLARLMPVGTPLTIV
jgi:lipoprotein-anchoring transpeptidase ErfK/SrfK